MTTRLMSCGRCGHRWHLPVEAPETRVSCPSCNEAICACGCGRLLYGMRADAVYATEACSKRLRRAASPDKGRTGHPLQTARAEQEASELNDRLGQIVYNTIIDRLKSAGSCHADDLEPYFPAEHRDRCRKLIGGQVGSLSGRHYIRETERRKSAVPTRKGAKSGVYVFTAKGRATLVGTGAGALPSAGISLGASSRSGEPAQSNTGVSESQGSGGAVPAPRSSGKELGGEASGELAPDASPEPLELPLETGGNYRDLDQRAA